LGPLHARCLRHCPRYSSHTPHSNGHRSGTQQRNSPPMWAGASQTPRTNAASLITPFLAQIPRNITRTLLTSRLAPRTLPSPSHRSLLSQCAGGDRTHEETAGHGQLSITLGLYLTKYDEYYIYRTWLGTVFYYLLLSSFIPHTLLIMLTYIFYHFILYNVFCID